MEIKVNCCESCGDTHVFVQNSGKNLFRSNDIEGELIILYDDSDTPYSYVLAYDCKIYYCEEVLQYI